MKIGLISDVHGNAPALSAVLSKLIQQKVEHILFAGDAIGYYPDVNEVCTLLRSKIITAIIGNHEGYLLQRIQVSKERWHSYMLDYVEKTIAGDHRVWLSTLPSEHSFEMGGVKFHLCHGSPWSIDEYIYPESKVFERFANLEFDYVIMGHTHIPLVRREGKVVLVNPGSCGQPRDYRPGACFGVLDTQTRRVQLHRLDYDLTRFVARLQDLSYPQKLINILLRTKEKTLDG